MKVLVQVEEGWKHSSTVAEWIVERVNQIPRKVVLSEVHNLCWPESRNFKKMKNFQKGSFLQRRTNHFLFLRTVGEIKKSQELLVEIFLWINTFTYK